MSTIGNLLWIIFGGFIIAVEYVIASILMMITIVGIPFGLQTLKMANLALWPFGRDTRSTEFATGCLGTIMNLLWIIVGGFWIFVSHIILLFDIRHLKAISLFLVLCLQQKGKYKGDNPEACEYYHRQSVVIAWNR